MKRMRWSRKVRCGGRMQGGMLGHASGTVPLPTMGVRCVRCCCTSACCVRGLAVLLPTLCHAL